jgi:hypothetical protein
MGGFVLQARPMPGVRPGGRPTFLHAQESRQRTRPCKTAHPAGGCPAMLEAQGRAELTSLRSVQTSGAKSVLEARCARALGFCASRRFRRGVSQTAEQPSSPTAKPASRLAPAVRYAPLSTAEQRKALRARARRASRTDSVQLFEQSVAARVLHGPSKPEQRRAPAAQRRAVRPGGAFCLLFGGPKSRSPAGANSRHHAPHKASATRQAPRQQRP